MTRRGRDSMLLSLRRPRPKGMVVSSSGYTRNWERGYLRTRYKVTSSGSRHLLAAIRCPSLRLDVLVGHESVQDEHGKQETWW